MDELNVMISSRCKTEIKDSSTSGTLLSDIREEIKQILECEELFGSKLYSVWISEDPCDVSALESSWETCMTHVQQADILIVIYTGEGGWYKTKGDIGICHAELEVAINQEPGKVYIIDARDATAGIINPKDPINEKFKSYCKKINRFYQMAKTKDEIVDVVKKCVAKATINLSKAGRREIRQDKYVIGEALDWTRMDFSNRKEAIESEIKTLFTQSGHLLTKKGCVQYSWETNKLLFCIHGIPSSMSTGAARELVGKPFLNDHTWIGDADKRYNGPIHLIGVHKNVTETQAISLLGFPDAVVVKGSFGIYVADGIQKIQIILLSNCRDSASTRHNVQRLLDWLDESGEMTNLVERAKGRRRIAELISRLV